MSFVVLLSTECLTTETRALNRALTGAISRFDFRAGTSAWPFFRVNIASYKIYYSTLFRGFRRLLAHPRRRAKGLPREIAVLAREAHVRAAPLAEPGRPAAEFTARFQDLCPARLSSFLPAVTI